MQHPSTRLLFASYRRGSGLRLAFARGQGFFNAWDIQDEPGETAVYLDGDVGLVPLPDLR